MDQNKFPPAKFKKLNFYIDWNQGLGLGIYVTNWAISIDILFFKVEVEYLTKKQIEDWNRVAGFFAQRAQEIK